MSTERKLNNYIGELTIFEFVLYSSINMFIYTGTISYFVFMIIILQFFIAIMYFNKRIILQRILLCLIFTSSILLPVLGLIFMPKYTRYGAVEKIKNDRYERLGYTVKCKVLTHGSKLNKDGNIIFSKGYDIIIKEKDQEYFCKFNPYSGEYTEGKILK